MNIKFSHFEELIKNGYSLDIVYILSIIEDADVNTLCCEMPKLEVLCQTIHRKGLVTDNYKLTTKGKELLSFIKTDGENTKLKKSKPKDDDFDRWWKAYPGTDTFTHNEKSFTGTRSMRVKKDDCKVKFNKILSEGEYTVDELIAALQYEVLQKKENSVKSKTNKLSFMQNSLTYLNQRTFEPFIELIREGATIKETKDVSGGTDI